MNQTVQNLSHRSKVAANCIVLKDGANVPAPQHRKKGYEQFVSESIISSLYFWTPAEHSFHFGFNITTFLLQGKNRKKVSYVAPLLYINNIKKHANVWVGHLKSGNTIHRQLNALYQGRGGSLGQRGQWHFRNLRTSKEEEGEADNAASQSNFYATQNYLTYALQFFWLLGKRWRICDFKTLSYHIDHCDSAVQWITLVLPLRIFWKIGRGAVVDQLVCQSFGPPLLTVKSTKSVVSCWWPKARSLHSSWKKSFHPF